MKGPCIISFGNARLLQLGAEALCSTWDFFARAWLGLNNDKLKLLSEFKGQSSPSLIWPQIRSLNNW
jgi:hypothetical protein